MTATLKTTPKWRCPRCGETLRARAYKVADLDGEVARAWWRLECPTHRTEANPAPRYPMVQVERFFR